MHFSQVFKDKMFASIKGDKDIAIRVTTIQKTQKPDLKAGLRVGCLRVASGKKKAGRPAGPDPSRRGFYGGEWEPWEVRSRGAARPDLHLQMAFRASHLCAEHHPLVPRKGLQRPGGALQRSKGWTPESSGGEGEAQAIACIK